MLIVIFSFKPWEWLASYFFTQYHPESNIALGLGNKGNDHQLVKEAHDLVLQNSLNKTCHLIQGEFIESWLLSYTLFAFIVSNFDRWVLSHLII